MENVNEGRSQIKRQYGPYAKIRVNETAPIRNSILNFVGKRFVTEEEMKSQLTKITEEVGKEFDQRTWFKNNKRYFESFENRGQTVWTLSKYGKRVYEFINKPKQNSITENKSIGLFKSSVLNESILNEGALAMKASKELDGVDIFIEEFDDEDVKTLHQGICDLLGEDPSNVYRVDSETAEEDPISDKIYNFLSNKLSPTSVDVPGYKLSTHGEDVALDKSLNAIRYDDNGFVAFFFTANSKF
jgi:hypothetical protein